MQSMRSPYAAYRSPFGPQYVYISLGFLVKPREKAGDWRCSWDRVGRERGGMASAMAQTRKQEEDDDDDTAQ
jgi:hypothetical protein